jgi:hypothetical protein
MDRPQAVVPEVVVRGMVLKHLTTLAVVVIHPQHLLLKETMAVAATLGILIIPVVAVEALVQSVATVVVVRAVQVVQEPQTL